MADNKKSKERLKEITDSIEQGIKDLFQSDKYMEYLRTMSRFHRYSFNNTILIAMQQPEATLVAGFNKWRDQFGRNVIKGEKGIKIIAPTPVKMKKEMEKLNPDTQTPMLDKDGKVITEEVEVKIPMYKVVSVFDISQTEGKPLPTLANNLTGDVKQYEIFMEALRRSSPVPIAYEAMEPNTDGYFSGKKQRIAIRPGMSEVQTVSAVIHEIAHSKLHNYEQTRLATAQGDESAEPSKPKNRRTKEVEAESVSYAVCAYYGIATSENSFGYIATWSKNKDLPELRSSLETINKTASGLIEDIDRNFSEIVKERGIDLTEPEPEIVPTEVEQWENSHIKDILASEQPVDKPEVALDRDDIDGHIGAFGIKCEEWAESREYFELAEEHELTQKELENSFLNNPADAFAIYQLKHAEETRDFRFEPLERIQAVGLTIERENYEFVYTGSLPEAKAPADTYQRLDDLFYKFNESRPEDFKGHSLSVSDIIALKQGGEVSCHYVDSFGFQELPGFFSGKNPLRGIEDSVEQNDNQLDGIINNMPSPTIAELEAQIKAGQTISLFDLANAVKDERRKECPSVLEQLKIASTKHELKTSALIQSAERER